jgi:hypothetical protein
VQLQKVRFIPEAIIEFTEEEIKALFQASEAHYDYKCQQASQPGGVLWGIRNQITDGKADVILKWRDIDLLGKIAEQLTFTHRKDPAFCARMNYGPQSFGGILQTLNIEYNKVNNQT